MRIIGGRLRGRKLVSTSAEIGSADRSLHLRPTSDRVREALFNLLAHGDYPLEGARVLDLFAGTGALGLEALSRGAARVLFVEENSLPRGLIRANIEALGVIGETKIYRRDATRLGPCREPQPFDLVFCDPPYAQGLGPKAILSAQAEGWLAPGAVIVLEGAADDPPPPLPGFEVLDHRQWGETRIDILRMS